MPFSSLSRLAVSGSFALEAVIHGYFNLFNIARYPDAGFRGAFKVIFSYVISVLFVANVPARLLARGLESPLRGLAQLAGAAVFASRASRGFWLFALRKYSSASS